MGKESSLWKTLNNGMKEYWEAERVENSVGLGMPDVYFTLKQNGKMWWMELKYLHEWPKRPSTIVKIPHYTPQQRNWIRRHGQLGANVCLLLQVNKDYLLFDIHSALNVGTMNKSDLIYWAEHHWKNHIQWSELHFFLL